MRSILAIVLLGLSTQTSLAEIEPSSGISEEQRTRLEEIQNYEEVGGTWEGPLQITAGPEEISGDRPDSRLRLVFSEDSVVVYVKWSPGDSWAQLGEDVSLADDQLGWHIFIARSGGSWIERWWFSFVRIEENEAEFVMSRTVHNILHLGEPGFTKYYRVFGDGQLKKT